MKISVHRKPTSPNLQNQLSHSSSVVKLLSKEKNLKGKRLKGKSNKLSKQSSKRVTVMCATIQWLSLALCPAITHSAYFAYAPSLSKRSSARCAEQCHQ